MQLEIQHEISPLQVSEYTPNMRQVGRFLIESHPIDSQSGYVIWWRDTKTSRLHGVMRRKVEQTPINEGLYALKRLLTQCKHDCEAYPNSFNAGERIFERTWRLGMFVASAYVPQMIVSEEVAFQFEVSFCKGDCNSVLLEGASRWGDVVFLAQASLLTYLVMPTIEAIDAYLEQEVVHA